MPALWSVSAADVAGLFTSNVGKMRAEDLAASRMRRRRFGVAAAVALALALPHAANAQLGSLLRNIAPMVPAATSAITAARTGAGTAPPAAGAAATTASPGTQPMGMQAPTALPPLKKLGTDAVAVVETATPKLPVSEMDYVFAKQTIALGAAGKITLSYLSGCRTEVITGGTVTVALTGSTVTGGKMQEKVTPGCRASHPILLASASEAGATVNRITPFSNVTWDERTLKSPAPVFKWDAALGVTSIQIRDMDKEGAPVVWQAPVPAREWIAYPPNPPLLTPGMPYRVEALAGSGVVAVALFSIDPMLDVADNMANRVVPLSRP